MQKIHDYSFETKCDLLENGLVKFAGKRLVVTQFLVKLVALQDA